MSEEKTENYDWEKLKTELKEISGRHGPITVVKPRHSPPRVMSGVCESITPLSPVVDTQQSSMLRILKTRKKSGIDVDYYYHTYTIPLTPPDKPLDSIILSVGNSRPSIHQQIFEQSKMTPQDLSTKLGFDTEAMIKPKTKADVIAVLDEIISEVDVLNKLLDEENKNFCREYFRQGEHSFAQYMDEKDNAHIEWLDPKIKKNILDNNLIGVSPWVEIFKIDGSYCNFTNKNGKVVGRLKMKYSSTSKKDTWVFESEPIAGTTWEYVCTKPYPYDCEREVIQWMVGLNLLEDFMNHNPE